MFRGGVKNGAEESGSNQIDSSQVANRPRFRRALQWLAPVALPVLLTLAVLGSLALPPTVKAATRTWDGGGANNLWNNPLNWSADTLPVAGDTVIFDGTSSKNADINVAVTVAIVQVNAGYGGTITQLPGVNFTVTSSYTQSAGSFVGGTTAVTVTGAFTVNVGGLFTSTTGTMTVTGAVNLGAGAFSHNAGSVVFSGSNVTLNLGGAATFNNVQFLSGTKTITVGDTMTVLGTLELTAGAVNGGTLAAQGNINARVGFTGGGTATLLINGAGNQVFDGDHMLTVGGLPNVNINKPSGALTLTDTLRTSRSWTYIAAPGGLTTTGSTVVFAANLTISGSHTLNNVEFRGGTVVLTAGTTLTAVGTTELFSGTINQAAATGTIAAQGNLNARVGFTGGGTATLLINGAGAQLFDGDHTVATGALPYVDINKPSGSLTLTDTLRTGRNWTYSAAPGGLAVTGTTLVFAGNLTISGSHTLDNVEIRSGTVVIAAGTTVTAAGHLNLFAGALNQSAATGIFAVHGNVDAQVGFTGGGSATVLLNGTADQTITGFHTVATGALPNVEINKPSGAVTIAGTLRTGRNWTYAAAPGGLTATGSTVAYAGNLTISGSHTLNNVEVRSGTVVIAAGTTLTVAGTTTLTDGDLNGGTLEALGNVNLLSTFDGETGTLRIAGAGDQTFTGSATSTTGDMANVVIDKPSGTLFLVGTIRLTTAAWTCVAGALNPGTSILVLDAGTTLAGSHILNDVVLRGGGHTVGAGMPTVGGLLTLENGTIVGGTLGAAGDVTQAAAFDGGTGLLTFTGAANQTFTGSATVSTGDLPDVNIEKPGGTFSLAGTIRLTSADWTHAAGAVNPGTSVVVFSGTSSVGAAGMTFFDMTVNGGTTTLAEDLFVVGDLTVSAGTLDGGGHTATIAGDLFVDGAIAADTLNLVLNGLAPQSVGGAGASIDVVDLDVNNTAGVTQGTTAMVSGTMTLNGPLDFSGETLGIANPIGGTPANLVGDPASSLEVFGTGAGIVIPSGISALANLTLENPNGVSLAGPMTIGQGLFLTDGIVEARPWVLTIGPGGTVTRTSGHVDGSLRKTAPLGSAVTVTFEIGDEATYAPAIVTFGAVLSSSTLTAVTTGGEHPNLGSSVISPSADVNRWWRVTNGGVVFDSADVMLGWAPSDVDPGADPAAFAVGRLVAGWTLPVVSNPTPTTIIAVGLTSFSDFAVGELENGDMPDTAGADRDRPTADPALRAAVIAAVLLGLVAIGAGLTRRPSRVAAGDRA